MSDLDSVAAGGSVFVSVGIADVDGVGDADADADADGVPSVSGDHGVSSCMLSFHSVQSRAHHLQRD